MAAARSRRLGALAPSLRRGHSTTERGAQESAGIAGQSSAAIAACRAHNDDGGFRFRVGTPRVYDRCYDAIMYRRVHRVIALALASQPPPLALASTPTVVPVA